MDAEKKRLLNHEIKITKNETYHTDSQGILVGLSEDGLSVLLQLHPALELDGIKYSHAIAKFRSIEVSFEKLLLDRQASCAITWIPDDKFDAAAPFNLGWWRGGAAAITDIRLI